MAESTKYQPINGGTTVSDIKNLIFVQKTRRTMAFAYGVIFVFIALTAFFVFNPSSNTSSPWFKDIFSISYSGYSNDSSVSNSSILSDNGGSDRSQFSSIYSFFFPNSSQQQQQSEQERQKQNFTSVAAQINNSRSGENHTKSFEIQKQSDNRVNKSKGEIFKPNQTTMEAPTENIPVRASNGENQTKIQAPLVAPSPEVQNQNRTSTQPVKTPVTANPKGNSPENSTSSEKIKSGKGEKSVSDKDLKSNYTASLVKKQNNGTQSAKQDYKNDDMIESLLNCNLFDGNWIRDDSYPLYKPGSCSLIDEQFNCFLNGRPDQSYHKLKWKPKGCTLPRLNAHNMLELLRGKRLVFVGDSLNRNMWESLVCILKTAIKDESKVYEASGRHHFRTEASYSFIFKDYGCTIEFFVSPFLVQEWDLAEKNGSTKETLRLDLIGRSADKYKDADFIIFNTGHWWTHDKTSKGKDYYQEGSHVYNNLNVIEAFRKALTTWARWVDASVNPKKSMVFFRGYSASHFSGGQWNSGGQCDSETEPIKNETYLSPYPPKMAVLENIIKNMKTHVSYLNITRITDYRKDGHPSIYRKQNLPEIERKSPLRYQDCSHWCLPGVPDAWNELLYTEMLIRMKKQQQRS